MTSDGEKIVPAGRSQQTFGSRCSRLTAGRSVATERVQGAPRFRERLATGARKRQEHRVARDRRDGDQLDRRPVAGEKRSLPHGLKPLSRAVHTADHGVERGPVRERRPALDELPYKPSVLALALGADLIR